MTSVGALLVGVGFNVEQDFEERINKRLNPTLKIKQKMTSLFSLNARIVK